MWSEQLPDSNLENKSLAEGQNISHTFEQASANKLTFWSTVQAIQRTENVSAKAYENRERHEHYTIPGLDGIEFSSTEERNFVYNFVNRNIYKKYEANKASTNESPFTAHNWWGDRLVCFEGNAFVSKPDFKLPFKAKDGMYSCPAPENTIKLLNTRTNRAALAKYCNQRRNDFRKWEVFQDQRIKKRVYTDESQFPVIQDLQETIKEKHNVEVKFLDTKEMKTMSSDQKREFLEDIDYILWELPTAIKSRLKVQTIVVDYSKGSMLWHTVPHEAWVININMNPERKTPLRSTFFHELFHLVDFIDGSAWDNNAFQRLGWVYLGEDPQSTVTLNCLLMTSKIETELLRNPWRLSDASLLTPLGEYVRKYNLPVTRDAKTWDNLAKIRSFKQGVSDALDKRPEGFVSRYAKTNADEDQSEVAKFLYTDTPELFDICKQDNLVRLKVEMVTGCWFNYSTGKLWGKLSIQDYKTRFRTTWYEYFPKHFPVLDYTYRNKRAEY